MRKTLPTLRRVAEMRLVREQQRVAEAASMLQTAERMLQHSEAGLHDAQARATSAEADFRRLPQCDHRHHLRAVTGGRLVDAQDTLASAQAARDEAAGTLSAARLSELRAKTKSDMIAERVASARRHARDRAAELEGEDRWTAVPIR